MKHIFIALIAISFNFYVMAQQALPLDFADLSDVSAKNLPLVHGADNILSPDDTAGESGLLPGARFTVTQELASQIREPYDVLNNRTSFRMEYEKHFFDDFYLHFDLIGTEFWANDHRAKADDVDALGESTVRDAYFQFSRGSTSVKLGRQILIWGESDAGAITDVISPRDYSELVFISLEKSRISQLMLTVDQFTQMGDWSFFYVPRAKYNKYPKRGDIYFIDAFEGVAQTTEDGKNLREYGARWKKTFGQSDISFMAARLIDNDYAIHQDGFTSDGRLLIKNEPHRFNMVGGTFNLAGPNVLLSGEIARKTPVTFFDQMSFQAINKDVVDTSLRVEYSLGNGGNHSISLEAVNRHVLNWDKEILPTQRNTNTLVLGWRNSFLNENLTVDWMTVYDATYTGFTYSLFTSYKLSDHMSFGFDTFYLSIQDRNNSMYAYRGKNNAIFRLSYQF